MLYVAVTVVLTGLMKYTKLGSAAPMADALKATGNPWAVGLVSLGAIAGLTTVVMIDLLGQSRVFFAMSRDRLLPGWLGEIHPRLGTPHRITLIVGIVVALMAMTIPVSALANLVSIGTLAAFVIVSIGVLVLRRRRPDLQRGFRVPALPVVSVLSVLACTYLMLNLAVETWIRFGVWMAIGFGVYFGYGRKHSRLEHRVTPPPGLPARERATCPNRREAQRAAAGRYAAAASQPPRDAQR